MRNLLRPAKRPSASWSVLWVLACLAVLGCGNGAQNGGGLDDGGDGPPPTTPAVHVRSEIGTFDADQIAALRAGVALMQGRQTTDPTSWTYQANIHGVPSAGDNCPPETTPMQTSWGTCQHGSFFFLAWHRIYLYYFENILRAAIREAIDDPSYEFALPYWDYEGGSPQLPPPFISPADPSNPLFVAQRRLSCNQAVPGQSCVTVSQGSATQALGTVPVCNCPSGQPSCDGCIAGLLPDETFHGQFTPTPVHFLSQFGELESQPHNTIHNRVGSFTGWMSDPNCAARDPIFWLHHANVDRLWQVWLNQNAGRVNPLASSAWKTQTFTFFDADGQAVQKTGCDILNMVTQLDYQYRDLPVENVVLCTDEAPSVAPPTGPPPAPEASLLAASEETGFTLGSEAVAVSVPVPSTVGEQITALTVTAEPEKLRLVVEGLELLGKGGVYDLYLNLPEGATPDPAGPHFVGHVSLFGHVGHGEGGGISRSFDVSDELRELSEAGALEGDLRLTFVPSDAEDTADARLRFRRATLVTREE